MKRLQVLLALALAGSMGSAAADALITPGYLGDLVDQSFSIGNSISGQGTSILDIYSFDIGSFTSKAIATSVKVKLQFDAGGPPIYDIDNFAITLKDADGTVYGTDSTFDSGGTLSLSATLLPSTVASPGFYQFVVSGTTTGTSGGLYAGSLAAAPVPEPKAWITLLAGLGLVGMMVERTKRRHG